jgi:hypothetical protein
MIGARLRHECGWSDARILNLSSRGLMVRARQAPPLGAYVEIHRGTHRIVARVVWAEQDLFGARTQDDIALDAITGGDEAPLPVAANLNDDRRDWRRRPPPAERHEQSRRSSRRMEFACIALFASAAAFLAFDTVAEVLSRPLRMVEARLGGVND